MVLPAGMAFGAGLGPSGAKDASALQTGGVVVALGAGVLAAGAGGLGILVVS